jgi:hypothetical protein
MSTNGGKWFVITDTQTGGRMVQYSDTKTPGDVADNDFITFVELLPYGTIVTYPYIPTTSRILTSHGSFVCIDDCVQVSADYGCIGSNSNIKHFTSNGTHIFVRDNKIVGLKFTETNQELIDPDETWFGHNMTKHLQDDSLFSEYMRLNKSDLMGDTEKEMKLENCKTLDEFVRVSHELCKWSQYQRFTISYIAEKKKIVARLTRARIDRANDDKARLAFEKIAEDALQDQIVKRRRLE